MNLGNRGKAAVLRAPFRAGHYRALLGMVRHYPDFAENAWRFLTARGDYPYACRIRTPLGIVAPVLYSSHDISTVNEVFCRGDYRVSRNLRVAVDIGSNIGISALYFLTRNASSRVYLFEPDPKNVARLRENLAAYSVRYELAEIAVALTDGEASFGVEPTGRYGTLLEAPEGYHQPHQHITVATRSINRVLEDILAHEERIDVLKIDTEGLESDLVAAIEPAYLRRIELIVYETDEPTPLHTERYRFHYSCQTNRLTARV